MGLGYGRGCKGARKAVIIPPVQCELRSCSALAAPFKLFAVLIVQCSADRTVQVVLLPLSARPHSPAHSPNPSMDI